MPENEPLWVKVKKSNNQMKIGLEELNRRKNSPGYRGWREERTKSRSTVTLGP
jgi:hypothetical protein